MVRKKLLVWPAIVALVVVLALSGFREMQLYRVSIKARAILRSHFTEREGNSRDVFDARSTPQALTDFACKEELLEKPENWSLMKSMGLTLRTTRCPPETYWVNGIELAMEGNFNEALVLLEYVESISVSRSDSGRLTCDLARTHFASANNATNAETAVEHLETGIAIAKKTKLNCGRLLVNAGGCVLNKIQRTDYDPGNRKRSIEQLGTICSNPESLAIE